MSSEFAWLTIGQVAALLSARKLSPRELLESLVCHIERHDSRINAFITIDADGARRAAAQAESEIQHGHYRGPLHEIPVAIKDNIWTAGLRTTAGSKILADVDAILAPTVPLSATAIGQKTVIIGSQEEAVRSAFIRLNRPANITGLPSLTVPCGFTSEGLPIGFQLIGRAYGHSDKMHP